MHPPELARTWNTPRLTLRPFSLRDVDDVFAYASDPEWGRYLPVRQPYPQADAEWFVARQVLADHRSEPRWALELEGRVVGSIELKLDHGQGTATLHYSIARSLWGQGLMTEAVRSVFAEAFGSLPGLVRIQAWADRRNLGSLRVMEKAGMQREGCSRSARVIRGERIDDVFCAILRDEWDTNRA